MHFTTFHNFSPPFFSVRYGPVIRFPFYIFCCWPQGTCAFIRMAGIVRGSVGGACINNFTFFFVGGAFKRRHLHFWNPSGQWWGQFAEMDKFSSFPHSAQYTGTQVHHITFYLVNPSIALNGWVTTQPKKNPPPKKKNQFTTFTIFHHFSPFFTIFHHFSPFFTIFHQPSQFYSGFRVVKTCHIL